MVVTTDQQRADFFAGEGFGIDTMPFLESFRPQGVWFSRAYSSLPVCMPARISLLTGRYATAHGMLANWSPIVASYSRDMVGLFRDLGYELALFGTNDSHARQEQFDVWCRYGHIAGPPVQGMEDQCVAFDRWIVELAHWVSHEPTPFPVQCQLCARIVSDAVGWLRSREDRPFFALLNLPEPHSPYQVPEPYFDLFPPDSVPARVAGPEALATKNRQWMQQYLTIKHYHPECDGVWRRYRSNYCGMLRLIDDQLRHLLGAMDEMGLLRSTIVVFLSDHGEFCGDYGLYRKGLALPQCIIRIPMFWFGGPVQPHPAPHPAHVSIADVFPTLCEALEVDLPAGVQGRSLWPLLLGQPYSEREFSSAYAEYGIGGEVLREEDVRQFGADAETVYVNGKPRTNLDGTRMASSGSRRAVVKGRWKLVYDAELPPELYDLDSDLGELHNLAGGDAIKPIQQELVEELLYWSVRLEDNLHVRRYKVKVPPHNWYR
jgi:arylsulfatase A-like enzyme